MDTSNAKFNWLVFPARIRPTTIMIFTITSSFQLAVFYLKM
jgi:hypothetical protein